MKGLQAVLFIKALLQFTGSCEMSTQVIEFDFNLTAWPAGPVP